MHPVDTDYLLVHRLYYELSCVVLQPFFVRYTIDCIPVGEHIVLMAPLL